jgi:uncharacterized damage-inducible protein DinB
MTTAQSVRSPKQQFLDGFQRETDTTVKVLKAYPADRLDLQPAPKSKTARDLVWLFVMEQALLEKALTTGFDWSKPMPKSPPPPESLEGLISAFEQGRTRVIELVRNTPDDALVAGIVQFFTAPKTVGNFAMLDFLWFILYDQIHHRGQFSVYLRMADGRLPSIYGPTADEPWN